MFDLDDRSWITKSTVAENADAEISFSLAPTFHPDPNSLDEESEIALPTFPTDGSQSENVPSSDVLDNEQPLIQHYKAVLQLAREHGQNFNGFEHHMWLRLNIASSGPAVSFAWYDTLEPMEMLFDWLDSAADGDTSSDVEQGWEMIVIRVGSYFHFRQGGFDQGGEHANIAFPRAHLLNSILALRKRIQIIINRLSAEIGEDYWSRYRRDLLKHDSF